MTFNNLLCQTVISLLLLGAVYLLVRHGWLVFLHFFRRQEIRLDRILNQQLLLDVSPRLVMAASVLCVLFCGTAAYLMGGQFLWFLIGAGAGICVPPLLIRHLEQRRQERIEQQLVDGIMTLASGIRAGLNLVQAMELLVANHAGPIQQEFTQLLREYQMGLDLNQAMRNAADRIGSSHYRLLFTAIEMHRLRGGDTGESLDRIAESIREIQRLEGKLDAITAQGRSQARMMAAAPLVILLMFYAIDPSDTRLLFTTAPGRILLFVALILITAGFVWIRKIMAIDI